MYVKGHKKTVGIPEAIVRVIAGTADIHLANQVVVLIKRANTPTEEVVASLRLSTDEARALALQLRGAAFDAERETQIQERLSGRANR